VRLLREKKRASAERESPPTEKNATASRSPCCQGEITGERQLKAY
jgi:hypothetical protein